MGQQLLLGLCLLLLTLIGAGCSTTKNLPEGEVLYEGIKRVTIAEQDPSDDGENTVSEINAALAYPPNNALLGSSSIRIPLPVGLWVYNAFVNKKGKIGQWIFKKFAAKPVLISTVNPEVRVKVAQNLLREYGYFQGSTGFEILTDEKNPRKAKIAYEIHMGKAYTLDDIRYIRMRRRTDSIIQSTATLSKLKVGGARAHRRPAPGQRLFLLPPGFHHLRRRHIALARQGLPAGQAQRGIAHPGAPSLANRRHLPLPVRLPERASNRLDPL